LSLVFLTVGQWSCANPGAVAGMMVIDTPSTIYDFVVEFATIDGEGVGEPPALFSSGARKTRESALGLNTINVLNSLKTRLRLP
jgi:hypothetical protein